MEGLLSLVSARLGYFPLPPQRMGQKKKKKKKKKGRNTNSE
jgi:hypothetical protein